MKIPLIVFAVLISQLAVPIGALRAERTFCIGKYKGGLKPSREELTDILKKYEEWLKTPPPTGRYDFSDPRRANLCEADL